jgi:hypothetical protein
VNLPMSWTGQSRHVLTEPWAPPQIVDSFERLIAELDAAPVPGLATTRRAFRAQGEIDAGSATFLALPESQRIAIAMEQILTLRVELMVAAQLQRAGALAQIRADTPDFVCRSGEGAFGVEVTTRARPEVVEALHGELERGLRDGPDVDVTVERTGALLFSENPAVVAAVSDQLVAYIKDSIASAAGQPYAAGSLPVPQLGLTARWTAGTGIGMPGARVVFEDSLMFSADQWTHHWQFAALQVKDTIEKKGKKNYSVPSLVVVDVSRLGETSRWLTDEGIAAFQAVVESCELGNLRGAMLVRSTLTAEAIVPLCQRLDKSVVLAAAAVILGVYAKPLIEA